LDIIRAETIKTINSSLKWFNRSSGWKQEFIWINIQRCEQGEGKKGAVSQALKIIAQRIGLHARGVDTFITSFLILVSLSD
jgi:hypothetical protein